MKKFTSVILTLSLILCIFVPVFAEDDEYKNTHANTGNAIADIVAVAETQVGYSGGKYGKSGAAFIYWCAKNANISEESIPNKETPADLCVFFEYSPFFHASSGYEPERGDIMFLGENGEVTLCAIVIGSSKDDVTAIVYDDGDDTVYKKMYGKSNSKILYYASPDYDILPNMTTGNHMTIASSLNLRKEPSVDSEILDKIPMGTIVNITGFSEDNEWGKVAYNGKEGWISLQYVKPFSDNHVDVGEYAVHWNVMDVSRHQGSIDWDRVKENNMDGVIIRIGYTGSYTKEVIMDERFLENYRGATEAGLPVGCYYYSVAETLEESKKEIDFIIDAIRDNNIRLSMPVYYDLEDTVIEEKGKEFINSIASQFFNSMEEANIYSGVYSNTYWLSKYFDPSIFGEHAVWVADWRDKCYYMGSYGMWQYSSRGSIAGVESVDTDLSICYIDYPKFIEDYKFNIEPEEPTGRVLGDLNGDSEVTASDARLALRISAKLYIPEDENINAVADVDYSGDVTASDARIILRVSAKLQSFDPEPESNSDEYLTGDFESEPESKSNA